MHNKRILITGGTGSLGTALVERWYNDNEITILSRDWHKQAQMTARFPNCRYVLTDICNYDDVYRACLGQDTLIHAAASKDVQTGEYHPIEFNRVNVQGSIVVATAWSRTHREPGPGGFPRLPRKALLISSDKAVSPINAYGQSKALATAVFRKHDYSIVRYGNVMGSNGSFIPKWRALIEAGQPITVRDPEPTRFYLKMSEAVDLIEDALRLIDAHGNGIFVPHTLRAFSVWDVALMTGARLCHEPLLPYEKQHESLVAPGEILNVVSPLLGRIAPGWDGKESMYCSANAPRMTGEEVLEDLGWSV